jgi:hypothetical protein
VKVEREREKKLFSKKSKSDNLKNKKGEIF